MTYVTETLGPDDWPQFKRLRLEMLSDAPAAFGSNHARESQYSKEEWRAFLQAFHPIVMKVGAETAGTAGYLLPSEEAPLRAKIVSMYVRPPFRREGLGRRLLSGIMSLIREETAATEAVLTVYEENAKAFELYRSTGFQVCGGGQQTEDGRKELLMCKALET